VKVAGLTAGDRLTHAGERLLEAAPAGIKSSHPGGGALRAEVVIGSDGDLSGVVAEAREPAQHACGRFGVRAQPGRRLCEF